jgi:hypothetical protein
MEEALPAVGEVDHPVVQGEVRGPIDLGEDNKKGYTPFYDSFSLNLLNGNFFSL